METIERISELTNTINEVYEKAYSAGMRQAEEQLCLRTKRIPITQIMLIFTCSRGECVGSVSKTVDELVYSGNPFCPDCEHNEMVCKPNCVVL